MLEQLDQGGSTALGVTKNNGNMETVVTAGVTSEKETPNLHDTQNVESGTSTEPPVVSDVSKEEAAQADGNETISSGSDISSDDDCDKNSGVIAVPDSDGKKKTKAGSADPEKLFLNDKERRQHRKLFSSHLPSLFSFLSFLIISPPLHNSAVTRAWNNSARIARLTRMKEEIEGYVHEYTKEASTIFGTGSLLSAPKKLDQTPGAPLRLPGSACTKTQFAFRQIVASLKDLQALASAAEFNQAAFLEKVGSTLDGWESFFSASFTEEVKVMVTKMQTLKGAISEEPAQLSPDAVSDLSEKSKQVDAMLEKAMPVSDQITKTQAHIDKTKARASKRQEHLGVLETTVVKNIKNMEEELATERAFLEFVQSLRQELPSFFEGEGTVREAIDTYSTEFNEVLAQGQALSQELHEFQSAGDIGGETLPAPVRALRTLISAYHIEE